MKLKVIFCIVFVYIISSLTFAQEKTDLNKMIIGTWNYDIAYDTIGVVATNNLVDTLNSYPLFITRLKIKKEKAVLSAFSKKLKATWQVKNNNQITFSLKNNRIITYKITLLTSTSFELKELSAYGITLGYKKK